MYTPTLCTRVQLQRQLWQPNRLPHRRSYSKNCELRWVRLAFARTISTVHQLCGRRLEALTCRAHHLLALTCCELLYCRYDGCNCCLPSSWWYRCNSQKGSATLGYYLWWCRLITDFCSKYPSFSDTGVLNIIIFRRYQSRFSEVWVP